MLSVCPKKSNVSGLGNKQKHKIIDLKQHLKILQDFSLNMEEVKDLTKTFQPDLVIIESGGDNLAANYSRELADYIIYVIDVAGQTFLMKHWVLLHVNCTVMLVKDKNNTRNIEIMHKKE